MFQQNKITFFGFKSGDADFNDVTSALGTQLSDRTGLNDATFGGLYRKFDKNLSGKITAVGTPDSFQYSVMEDPLLMV